MEGKKHTILVVDDDADVLNVFKLVLEKHGYGMVGAESAEEGLLAFQKAKPDLIIVDLMMEEVDSGTTLVKSLQAQGNTAPVYMLSSVGDGLHSSTDYAELGLAGIFQKPIDTETLLSTLKTMLK